MYHYLVESKKKTAPPPPATTAIWYMKDQQNTQPLTRGTASCGTLEQLKVMAEVPAPTKTSCAGTVTKPLPPLCDRHWTFSFIAH